MIRGFYFLVLNGLFFVVYIYVYIVDVSSYLFFFFDIKDKRSNLVVWVIFAVIWPNIYCCYLGFCWFYLFKRLRIVFRWAKIIFVESKFLRFSSQVFNIYIF